MGGEPDSKNCFFNQKELMENFQCVCKCITSNMYVSRILYMNFVYAGASSLQMRCTCTRVKHTAHWAAKKSNVYGNAVMP